MQTRTDLANAALAYLGEMQISDINDDSSKPARTCKQFMGDTILEVLRSHRWSCAISRSVLALSGDAPAWGQYDKQYILPNDYLQLLEINGEQPDISQQYFEIEGNFILSSWTECKIRYVRQIDVPDFDPLLAKAIALNLAAKICVPLTLNAGLQQSCVVQYNGAVQEAKRINAIEKTTNANHSWGRLCGTSPLVRTRGWSYGYPYRWGYYAIPGGPL